MAKLAGLFKHTLKEWKKHNPLFIAAAISFYVILSLGPILVVLLFAASQILSQGSASGELIKELEGVVGPKASGVIKNIIQQVTTGSGKEITLLASIPLIFFGSTMIFFQLKYALNIIFGEKKDGPGSFKETIRQYSFSFLMLFIIGGVFLLLILKDPVLNLLKDNINDVLPVPWLAFRIIEIVFSFLLLVFIFVMVYKILPDKKMNFKDLLIGSFVTAFLFAVVQFLVGMNAENTEINNAYGAIGPITILILWIFYSSLVFLFGASFTKVLSLRRSKTG